MTLAASSSEQGLCAHQMSTKFIDLLTKILKPSSNSFCFQVEGLLFYVSLTPVDNRTHLHITSEIGFLPFTEESAQKRRMLSSVLSRAADLDGPIFDLGSDGKITVTGDVLVTQEDSPIFSFSRIIQFIHQILPYTRLIGKIL